MFAKDVLAWSQLRAAVVNAGHAWFSGHLNVNLVGVRTRSVLSNRFDDYVIVACDVGETKRVLVFPATTDPGAHYLQNPLAVTGTAVMAPGQYRGAYRLGAHKGRPALVNTGRVAPTYFRDADRDLELDFKGEPRSDYIGLNIHRSGSGLDLDKPVGRWSAGCQVLAYDADMDLLLHVCRQSAARYGEFFTYTLLDAWW